MCHADSLPHISFISETLHSALFLPPTSPIPLSSSPGCQFSSFLPLSSLPPPLLLGTTFPHSRPLSGHLPWAYRAPGSPRSSLTAVRPRWGLGRGMSPEIPLGGGLPQPSRTGGWEKEEGPFPVLFSAAGSQELYADPYLNSSRWMFWMGTLKEGVSGCFGTRGYKP